MADEAAVPDGGARSAAWASTMEADAIRGSAERDSARLPMPHSAIRAMLESMKSRTMTANPVPGHIPTSAYRTPAHGRLARWGVRLGATAAAMTATAFALFALATAIGGSGATEDNWVGYLVGVLLAGGLLGSLAAFALAIPAKVKHERWALLWLPLLLFPAILAFLAIGEAFWWE